MKINKRQSRAISALIPRYRGLTPNAEEGKKKHDKDPSESPREKKKPIAHKKWFGKLSDVPAGITRHLVDDGEFATENLLWTSRDFSNAVIIWFLKWDAESLAQVDDRVPCGTLSSLDKVVGSYWRRQCTQGNISSEIAHSFQIHFGLWVNLWCLLWYRTYTPVGKRYGSSLWRR